MAVCEGRSKCFPHSKKGYTVSEKQKVNQHPNHTSWLTWASFVQPASRSSEVALAHLWPGNKFVSSRV